MKRDFDLIRAIILELEARQEFEEKQFYEALERRYQWKDIRGHLELLEREGMVTWEFICSDGSHYRLRLKWKGHDLADAMRSEVAWSRVRGQIKNGISLKELMELLWENQ